MKEHSSDLGPTLGGLFEVAQRDLPSADQQARALTAVLAAGGVATLGAAGAVHSAHGIAGAKAATWTKVLLVALGVGGTVGAAALVLRPDAPAQPGVHVGSQPVPPPAAVVAPASEPAAAPQAAPAVEAAPIAPKSHDIKGAASQAEELEILKSAREALNTAPAQALALVSRHAARFPHSALVQEREMIRIRALSALGRSAEASKAARDFEQKYPNSIHQGSAAAVTNATPKK
jgi:hypothetical protein